MNVYEIITERISDKLNQGTIPWHKPWKGGPSDLPHNGATNHEYRGANVWMLGCQGYDSPKWLTFKQVNALKGKIRKGERSTPVIFWKWNKKTDSEGKEQSFPFLRYYNVWNVEQCDDLPERLTLPKEESLPEFEPIAACEELTSMYLKRETIELQEKSNRAFYMPSGDYINMPKRDSFKVGEEYYATMFHEMGHSTGHANRLKRTGIVGSHYFGDSVYSKEELCAEMTAAFLCGVHNIDNVTIENSAAYIQSWLKRLKDDRRLVVQAAAQAQKAADFILGVESGVEQ